MPCYCYCLTTLLQSRVHGLMTANNMLLLRPGCNYVLRQSGRQWLASMQQTRPTKIPRRDLTSSATQQDPESETVMNCSALDDEDWQGLQAHLARYDTQRETVIKRSRDAQKAAKQAIYSLHRGDFHKASQQFGTVEQVGKELLPIIEQEPTLRQGSFASAMEEYAEGKVFCTYLQEGRVLKSTELDTLVNVDEYLGGVLDFTGELLRWAVARATARDVAAVRGARDVVDALQGQFLQMDLRNGSLRKKFDSLKYTEKKLENMLYELSLAGAPGLSMPGSKDDEEPPDGTMQDEGQA